MANLWSKYIHAGIDFGVGDCMGHYPYQRVMGISPPGNYTYQFIIEYHMEVGIVLTSLRLISLYGRCIDLNVDEF